MKAARPAHHPIEKWTTRPANSGATMSTKLQNKSLEPLGELGGCILKAPVVKCPLGLRGGNRRSPGVPGRGSSVCWSVCTRRELGCLGIAPLLPTTARRWNLATCRQRHTRCESADTQGVPSARSKQASECGLLGEIFMILTVERRSVPSITPSGAQETAILREMVMSISTPREARGPLVVRRRLGARLKHLREAANIRLDAASAHIECSVSKLSRLEHGQGIPRAIEISALLNFYGVDDDQERVQLLMWADRAKATTWWQPYSDAVAGDLELYISLEAEARLIRSFTQGALHGIVQTKDFATATIESHVPADAKRLKTLVEVRMKRRAILEREQPHPVRFELILGEEALLRRVGSDQLMQRQLTHLITMSREPNVSVSVLPLRSRRPVANSIFTVFTPFDDADWEVVNEEGNILDHWFETRDQVDAFKAIWIDLQGHSKSGDDARNLITDVLRSEYGWSAKGDRE